MRASVTLTKSNGDSLTIWYDDGPSAPGTAKTIAGWNGVAQEVEQYRAFRWRLTRAKDVGETVAYSDASRARLHVVKFGQSNAEGRGDSAGAAEPANAAMILPSTWPEDPDSVTPNEVGPGRYFAGALIDEGAPYDAIAVHSIATAGASLATMWGTDGTDGGYATQIAREAGMRGTQSADPPSEMESGDSYVLLVTHGESDSLDSGSADYSADLTQQLDQIQADWPGATCLAIVIARLPPSAPDGSYVNWATVRAEQASLSAPSATPPVVVVDLEDADRKVGDEVHLTDEGQLRWAEAAAAAAWAVMS